MFRRKTDLIDPEALELVKLQYFDRLMRIKKATDALWIAVGDECADMARNDKPRPPRFTYKFWSLTFPVSLLGGALSGFVFWLLKH